MLGAAVHTMLVFLKLKTMTTVLAVDTSTEACSVALLGADEVQYRWALLPREHSRRLLPMLAEVVESGDLVAAGVERLAYGCGPGSFTGLRIAASAVQGLSFTSGLPVAAVSTLAAMAQGLLRAGQLQGGQRVLCVLDARINEVYWGVYECVGDTVVSCISDQVSAPGELPFDALQGLQLAVCCGSGVASVLQQEKADLLNQSAVLLHEHWPDARDVAALAVRVPDEDLQAAEAVQPVYLRNEISWKKLAEQGGKR